MDLFTLIKVVFSHWRVVVPIGILTLGLAFYVQSTTPSEYEANGYLVLDAPEASGETSMSSAIDLDGLAQGIELEGETQGRNFTVTNLGGSNYSIAAAAPSADVAEQDAGAVVDGLAQRVRAIQDDQQVPESGRLDLRLVDPQIVAEEQADGSFLATATVFLNDPAAVGENPYPPTSYTGRLLQVGVMGDSGLARFDALTGGDVELVVGQEARDAAPLLQVVTIGADPQAVIDGFFHARDIMVEDLSARQERADLLPRQRTTLSVVDAPLGVVDQSPPVERATAAVIALGGLLALGVAIGLEGWRRRSGPMGSLRDLMTSGADGDDDHDPDDMASGRGSTRAVESPLDARLRAAMAEPIADDGAGQAVGRPRNGRTNGDVRGGGLASRGGARGEDVPADRS